MAKSTKRIDAMTAKTTDWRGEALARFRRLIRDADPQITEEMKWKRASNPTGVPVFEHGGIVCMIVILKERVRLKFVEGAKLPDPKRLFNAELEGDYGRAIDVYEGDRINETAVKALVRAAVARNVVKTKKKTSPRPRSIRR